MDRFRMRPGFPFWVASLVVAAGVAGCANAPEPGAGAPDGDPMRILAPAALSPQLAAAAPYSILLCHQGVRILPFGPGNATDVDACNFEVTTKNLEGNEVTIAVNPTDPTNLFGGAKDYTLGPDGTCGQWNVWMGTYWSTDGGRTWGNDLMPGYPGDTRASPLAGNLCNTDPVAVYDSDGTAWYSGLNYRGGRQGSPTSGLPNPAGEGDLYTGSQVYFARSEDGGATYSDIFFASFGDNDNVFNDKQWFAVDPASDQMVLTWTDFFPVASGIFASVSQDQGRTWSPPISLTKAVGLLPTGQFSMPQYGPDGQLYVIWLSGTGVVFARSVQHAAGTSDAAVGFHPATPAFDVDAIGKVPNSDFRTSTYPVMAVDTSDGPYRGRIYVTWADDRFGDADVLLAFSDDEGLTWSDPMRVNDDVEGNGASQFMPWIDVGPDGDVHIAFYDRRDDPANYHLHIYYAYSADGGATFAPNLRVTEVASDGKWAHHQSGAEFIGDYIGVDASDVAVHIIWADTRHQTSDVYAATILRSAADYAVFDALPATPGWIPSNATQEA